MRNLVASGILLTLMFSFAHLPAQETWQHLLSGPSKMVGHRLAASPDSGVVVASATQATPQQVILTKLSGSGQVDWRSVWRQTAGTGYMGVSDLITLGDSGYVMLGTSWDDYDFFTTVNSLLIRFDALGDTLWTLSLGDTTYEDFGRGVSQCANGDLLVTGEANAIADPRVWLYRVSSSGQLLWGKVYETDSESEGNKAIETSTGDIIMIGKYSLGGNSKAQIWKLDSNGGLIWQRNFEGDRAELYDVVETPSGNYLFTGRKKGFTSSFEVGVFELAPNGTPNWFRSFFSQSNNSVMGLEIQSGDSGTHYISHRARGWTTVEYGFIGVLHIDSQGNLLADQIYEPDNGAGWEASMSSFVRGVDGGVYLAGSFCGLTDCPLYVLKTDPQLRVGCSDQPGNPQVNGFASTITDTIVYTAQSYNPLYRYPISRDTFTSAIQPICTPVALEEELDGAGELKVWPNPGNSLMSFETVDQGLDELKIAVFNGQGQEVMRCRLQGGRANWEPDVEAGIYFAVLYRNGQVIDQKRIGVMK